MKAVTVADTGVKILDVNIPKPNNQAYTAGIGKT